MTLELKLGKIKILNINGAIVETKVNNLALLLDSKFSPLKKIPSINAPKLGKKIIKESK